MCLSAISKAFEINYKVPTYKTFFLCPGCSSYSHRGFRVPNVLRRFTAAMEFEHYVARESTLSTWLALARLEEMVSTDELKLVPKLLKILNHQIVKSSAVVLHMNFINYQPHVLRTNIWACKNKGNWSNNRNHCLLKKMWSSNKQTCRREIKNT